MKGAHHSIVRRRASCRRVVSSLRGRAADSTEPPRPPQPARQQPPTAAEPDDHRHRPARRIWRARRRHRDQDEHRHPQHSAGADGHFRKADRGSGDPLGRRAADLRSRRDARHRREQPRPVHAARQQHHRRLLRRRRPRRRPIFPRFLQRRSGRGAQGPQRHDLRPRRRRRDRQPGHQARQPSATIARR